MGAAIGFAIFNPRGLYLDEIVVME